MLGRDDGELKLCLLAPPRQAPRSAPPGELDRYQVAREDPLAPGTTTLFSWGGAAEKVVTVMLTQPRGEAAMSATEDRGGGASGRAVQQAPGLWRTDLQRQDLSVPGREVVQSRVDIGPEAPSVKHTHPGEEIIYILEGSLEYQIDGQPPMTVNAGDALTVPAGVVHAVRNVGSGNAAELATYVVEKGKPLLTLAE